MKVIFYTVGIILVSSLFAFADHGEAPLMKVPVHRLGINQRSSEMPFPSDMECLPQPVYGH